LGSSAKRVNRIPHTSGDEPISTIKVKRVNFKCRKCNYQSNDDRTGAMNLLRKGVEYVENASTKYSE
jgi:transposase-like protein